MAQTSCPLTTGYLRVLRQDIEEAGWQLYDDLHSNFEEVQERAEGIRYQPTAVCLRGFYAVEVLYHRLLPQLTIPRVPVRNLSKGVNKPTLDSLAEGSDLLQKISSWRAPRSYEGLTDLIGKIRRIQEDTELEDFALHLDSRVEAATRVMRAEKVSPWREFLTHAEKMVEELRRNLSQKKIGAWRSIGTRFATSCLISNQEMSVCLGYAHTLLAINQENAVTPWIR